MTVARSVLLMLVVAVGSVSAQEQAKTDTSRDRTTTPKCTPTNTTLKDGTLVSIGPDCSVRAVSKAEILDREKKAAADVDPSSNKASPNASGGPLPIKDPLLPDPPLPGLVSKEVQQKYIESLEGYYDYHTVGFQHRQLVFRWQLASSRVIFVIVLVLVASGIYFAALQFHAGLRRGALQQVGAPKSMVVGAGAVGSQPVTTTDDVGEGVTTFSASLKGIKVSSPILGVVILTISLAFFYLYLVYVYPIKDTF
jgi:hypothetical protein